jgi:8-oxo-dGTP pyrophosphatase MutT (NUDIX family)
MSRVYRYQGAIIHHQHILLIRHREHASGRDYWLVPGGGIEPGETEEGCVIREIKEETHLDVKVERLLLEEYWEEDRVYQGAKTFLCTPLSGKAKPGYEPEPEAASLYAIVEVRWVDMRDESTWGDKIKSDHLTYPWLKRIQALLVQE